jgi:DNA-binding transcriptional LysR family regulator
MAADTLTGIRVFCRVVELKSFAAAARQLGLSAAMVSKHVMQLERRLGNRLLNRSSRHLSLTEAGAAYHARTLPLLEELDHIESTLSQSAQQPRGTLRITAPAWFANPQFTTILSRYQRRHPHVSLDLDLAGRMVNLIEEGFDLALRVTRTPGEALISRPLCSVSFRFVATPEYLRDVGTPRTLRDLARLPFLYYSLAPLTDLTTQGPHGEESVRLNSRFKCTNESLLHLAALHGMGIALLPDMLIEADLKAGRLQVLLPDYPVPSVPLLGIYPNRRHLSLKVRSFLDFMVDAMARSLSE